MKPVVKIKNISIESKNSVKVSFEFSQKLKNLFLEDSFFVEYNKEITNVPKSILVIPFLSNIMPIVWATDSTLIIDEIDEDFYNALEKIKQSFQKMYPQISFKGNIDASTFVTSEKKLKTDRPAILFSGGADSLTTYIRNKENNPFLVTVWGADISLKQLDAWNLVKRNIDTFAQKYGNESLIIKSNLRSFINEAALNAKYGKSVVNWWGGVQHGLALLGLCAPISFALGFNHIYIPSTHTETFSAPWGSHPTIDNNVKWSETEVIHDGYELGRQDKIHVISNYIKKDDPDLMIRVCYSSSDGNNCGKCEKCNRTVTGLMIEGVDARNHGFPGLNVEYVQKQFKQGKWNLGEDEVYMWEDMKNAYTKYQPSVPAEYKEYFQWLASSDFSFFHKVSSKNKYRQIKQLSGFLPKSLYLQLKSIKQKLPL